MADTKKTATADNAGKELPAPARTRGGALAFFRDVRREGSKVTWPSWRETWLTTMLVFIMVGVTMVFFLAVDSALGVLVRWVLSSAG
jgi:preprotein translocase subunit SecE